MTAAPHHETAPPAHPDVVVLDYLAALWAESGDLSPQLRDELMSTVADYIAMRRTSIADPIADPEQIVGRLGPPEVLVAAVRRGRMPAHLRLPAPPRRPAAACGGGPAQSESTAIALLMAGTFVLPVISALAAMVIVSGSPRWNPSQKAVAWVLTGGATAAALALVLVAVLFGPGRGAAAVLAYPAAVTGSFVAGICLLPGLFPRRPGTP